MAESKVEEFRCNALILEPLNGIIKSLKPTFGYLKARDKLQPSRVSEGLDSSSLDPCQDVDCEFWNRGAKGDPVDRALLDEPNLLGGTGGHDLIVVEGEAVSEHSLYGDH